METITKHKSLFQYQILCVFAVLIGLAGYVGYHYVWRTKPTVSVTVFVHGTIGSTFNFLNPFQCITDSTTDETWGVRALKKYRNSASLRYDQIFGDEGLIEFGSEQFMGGSAAHHLIAAYDEFADFAHITADHNHYALFGWSGLLSHQARKEASFEFYNQLTLYCAELKKQYGVEPTVRIIAHSHGGNVALMLAHAAQEKSQDLEGTLPQIETLFMLGTPMYRETAEYIRSELFRTIILGYSHGDAVQGRDYFSTAERKSFMRMADVIDLDSFVQQHPGYARADMRFIVDGDDKRITHTNMWLLARSVPILSFMDPLPLVAVVPVFIASLDSQQTCIHYEAHLQGGTAACSAFLVSCIEESTPVEQQKSFKPQKKKSEEKLQADSRLFNLMFKWRNKLFAEWRQDDISRHAIMNSKNLRSVFHALTGW